MSSSGSKNSSLLAWILLALSFIKYVTLSKKLYLTHGFFNRKTKYSNYFVGCYSSKWDIKLVKDFSGCEDVKRNQWKLVIFTIVVIIITDEIDLSLQLVENKSKKRKSLINENGLFFLAPGVGPIKYSKKTAVFHLHLIVAKESKQECVCWGQKMSFSLKLWGG